MEKKYYSTKTIRLPQVCYHCGCKNQLLGINTIKELKTRLAKVRSVCFICFIVGKEPLSVKAITIQRKRKFEDLSKANWKHYIILRHYRCVFNWRKVLLCAFTIIELFYWTKHCCVLVEYFHTDTFVFPVFISSIESVEKSLTCLFLSLHIFTSCSRIFSFKCFARDNIISFSIVLKLCNEIFCPQNK